VAAETLVGIVARPEPVRSLKEASSFVVIVAPVVGCGLMTGGGGIGIPRY
jgi:hypothetical protein